VTENATDKHTAVRGTRVSPARSFDLICKINFV
jgi:hypothetical protein